MELHKDTLLAELREFVLLVETMRVTQDIYFRTKDKNIMHQSMAYETKVDKRIEEICDKYGFNQIA